MKIAVNALSITPIRGGVATYLVSLARHLSKIDQRNIYFLFTTPFNETMFTGLGKNFEKILIPLRSDNRFRRLLYEQLIISYYVKKHGIQVLFSPANLAILLAQCKQITMVHDLHYRLIPKALDQFRVWYYKFMFPISVWRSDMIIVPSEATRVALLQTVVCRPEKIRVIPEGVAFNTQRNRKIENNRSTILFVSSLFPFKNADKLIRAYARISDKVPYPLVFVGHDHGGLVPTLKELASSLRISERVHFVGYVDTVDPWYDRALVFVYPSAQEGFGLPPLEAMAHGVPVIGSNRGSIPEVIGDAGLIVDPDNIEGLAGAIYQVLTDAKLRQDLIERGYKRVEMFSWEKTARETLRVFEEVYQR